MESKKFNLDNVHLVRSSDIRIIEVYCPDKFDENDLACFWCNHSDECRRDFENENLQSKTE